MVGSCPCHKCWSRLKCFACWVNHSSLSVCIVSDEEKLFYNTNNWCLYKEILEQILQNLFCKLDRFYAPGKQCRINETVQPTKKIDLIWFRSQTYQTFWRKFTKSFFKLVRSVNADYFYVSYKTIQPTEKIE